MVYSELQRFNNDNMGKVFNILLNDKIEEVNWNQMKNTAYSIFKEKSYHFNEFNLNFYYIRLFIYKL